MSTPAADEATHALRRLHDLGVLPGGDGSATQAPLWRDSALVLLAGLAQAVSMAVPSSGLAGSLFGWFDGTPLWWLQLASLALFAHRLLAQDRVRRAAWLGGLFATAWIALTTWWLFISMHVYGGLWAPLAALAVLALAAFLSLYYAAAAALCVAWWRRAQRTGRHAEALAPLVFALLWTLAELARGQWLTGFPWGAGGYAHVDGPLSGWAPWVGVYGLGAVAAGLAALLPRLARCGAVPRVLALALVALPVVAPEAQQGFTRPAGTLRLVLLQGNIAQSEKFQPRTGIEQALAWYRAGIEDAVARRIDLVVIPETAIPLLPQQLPEGWWDGLLNAFRADGVRTAALVGMPLGDRRSGYTNSVLGLAPAPRGQPVDGWRYDKHHLVPFGEFIPPLFRWFTDLMQIPLGDFERGALAQPPFTWLGQRLAANICYEDLFGEEIGAHFRDAARAPTVLVNVSNIAWFGPTVAIDQHQSISRMRALEFGRPMVRATNTGATVVIDHRGQITHALPRHTRGALDATVQGREGLTPYARWVSVAGLAPLWALLLAALALVAALSLRGRRAPDGPAGPR